MLTKSTLFSSLHAVGRPSEESENNVKNKNSARENVRSKNLYQPFSYSQNASSMGIWVFVHEPWANKSVFRVNAILYYTVAVVNRFL